MSAIDADTSVSACNRSACLVGNRAAKRCVLLDPDRRIGTAVTCGTDCTGVGYAHFNLAEDQSAL